MASVWGLALCPCQPLPQERQWSCVPYRRRLRLLHLPHPLGLRPGVPSVRLALCTQGLATPWQRKGAGSDRAWEAGKRFRASVEIGYKGQGAAGHYPVTSPKQGPVSHKRSNSRRVQHREAGSPSPWDPDPSTFQRSIRKGAANPSKAHS